MDLDLVAPAEVGGGRAQRAHVGAVAELGLRVAAHHLARLDARQPVRLLLLGAHRLDVGHEHGEVDVVGQHLAHHTTGHQELLVAPAVLALELWVAARAAGVSAGGVCGLNVLWHL